jgi:hypothetical protein
VSFCLQRGQFGAGAVTYKLADQRPLFYVRDTPPQFTRRQWIEACSEAFGRWSEVCDVIFQPTDDERLAQFVIFTHHFDGPLGILADCELPAPRLTQQALRIDPTEKLQISDTPDPGYLSALAILGHEMGHGLGLQHFPVGPPAEWMEPSLSSISRPQATEAAYVAKLYGPAKRKTPPTPVPPLGDSLGVEMIITQGNRRFKATGKAFPTT